jgi:hypothetical protein
VDKSRCIRHHWRPSMSFCCYDQFLAKGETYRVLPKDHAGCFRPVHQRTCHRFQITRARYQRKQNSDREIKMSCTVPAVKARSSCSVSCMRKRDNGRGNRRADVSTHYDRYRVQCRAPWLPTRNIIPVVVLLLHQYSRENASHE